MEDWINIHTHRPGKGINIVDTCLGDIVLPRDGEVYYSCGIHPLFINGAEQARFNEMEQAAADKSIVAVGEAGIDRHSMSPLEEQQLWFERQASLAARYNLPLIIHGVRAIPEIIALHKKCASPTKWIMHGFNNRREVLQDLLRHGFYISVGRQVMNRESNVYALLPEIPDNRLFIETDDSEWTIDEIYRMVAQRRETSLEELQRIVHANFNKLFQI